MGNAINIWLDDQRNAPNGWIHLHNIEEVEKRIGLVLEFDVFSIDTMSTEFAEGFDSEILLNLL